MQTEGESLTNHKWVRGLVVTSAAGSCENARNIAVLFLLRGFNSKTYKLYFKSQEEDLLSSCVALCVFTL